MIILIETEENDRFGIFVKGKIEMVGKDITDDRTFIFSMKDNQIKKYDNKERYFSFYLSYPINNTLFEVGKVKGGMSLDFSFPTFQNAIINTGLQVLFFDIVKVKIGEELNIRELVAGKASVIPSISLSAKIGINTKDDSFFAKQGWQQSEIVPSMGYRNLYNGVHAASVGVTAHLGLKDTNAPEINLW